MKICPAVILASLPILILFVIICINEFLFTVGDGSNVSFLSSRVEASMYRLPENFIWPSLMVEAVPRAEMDLNEVRSEILVKSIRDVAWTSKESLYFTSI